MDVFHPASCSRIYHHKAQNKPAYLFIYLFKIRIKKRFLEDTKVQNTNSLFSFFLMPKFCIVTKYLLYKGDFWGEKKSINTLALFSGRKV
jgi:hypothetical protein